MNIRLLLILILFNGLFTLNIFGQEIEDTSYVVVSEVLITGNNTTKEQVIKRELLFNTGDSIARENLDEILKKTKENLFNTSLFNFITIKILEENIGYIRLLVMVEERWYLWPYPIFEHADRNFSSFLHEQDWSKINYGLFLVKNNFRGRRETLKLKARIGYKEQFQVYYENPYFSRNKKHGFIVQASWFQQHEISYTTQNDELMFFKDEDKYVRQYLDVYGGYQFRNQHYTNHRIFFGYTQGSVSDTVVKLNPDYYEHNQTSTRFLNVQYSFEHDKRDYKHYPLFGYFIGVNLAQKGLGMLKDGLNGITSIDVEANKYFKHSEHWYTGFGAKAKLSSTKKQPFFIEQALGYGDYLRSLEYNVINGQHYYTTRSFLKYAIIPMSVAHFESWSWNKFNKIHYSLFANLFFDTGYVYNRFELPTNDLPNTFLMSFGIGIDLVTYYDQIFRFEYSANQLGQHGFFIHIGKAF